jgi:hypothetical protein
MNTRDGTPPQRGGKSNIVGAFFIQHDARGRPVATGRIVKGIRAGVYMLAYISREPGVPALSPTATIEQIEKHNFELWAHESNWQRAYADALRRGTPNETSTT